MDRPKGGGGPAPPRPEPRFEGDLTADRIRWIFRDSADFGERPVLIGGDPAKRTTAFFLNGQVRNERMNDYILRPLATSPLLREATPQAAFRMMTEGIVYTQLVQVCTTLDQAVFALINGSVVFAFPGEGRMISYFAATEEKRALSPPENEPSLKGARDSFVESLRTNTSLVRRRLRAPELKIAEVIAGRQTVTPVDILYIEGITNPDLVAETKRRLAAVDTDELLQTSSLEELIVDEVDTAFPMIAYTERPDRFCAGLVEGRVGGHCGRHPPGLPAAGHRGPVLQTGQDRAQNWVAASFLSVLRYLCMLLSLFLPAWYVAAVNFSPGDDPRRLAWSISEAKTDVPFSTIFEVLIMLLAFEAVQEAASGCRGPSAQTGPSDPRRPGGGLGSGGRPPSSPRWSSSWWPSPALPGTPCPARSLLPPCGSGGLGWPSPPAWGGLFGVMALAAVAGIPPGPAGELRGALPHPLRRLGGTSGPRATG